jgi:hypothetical protein
MWVNSTLMQRRVTTEQTVAESIGSSSKSTKGRRK